MASVAVQFFGKDEVLEGYDFKQVETWAIFQGRSLIMSGDDRQQLDQFLTMLCRSGGNAIYVLCMYNNVTADSITNKTEYNASYGFKLEPAGSGEVTQRRPGSSPYYNTDPITQAVHAKIAERMGAVVDEVLSGEKEEKPPTLMEIISGHLQDPAIAVAAIGLIDKMVSGVLGKVQSAPVVPMQQNAMAAIGSVAPAVSEDVEKRLVTAINTLEKNDAKIVEHLEKLASISENNPVMFRTLLGMLEGM